MKQFCSFRFMRISLGAVEDHRFFISDRFGHHLDDAPGISAESAWLRAR